MEDMQSQEQKTDVDMVLVGRVPIGLDGDHQIPPAETDDEAQAIAEKGRQHIVAVQDADTACCIDGRPAVCTAEMAQQLGPDASVEAMRNLQHEPVAIVAKVPGGLHHFATMMLLGSDAALKQDVTTYQDATAITSGFLAAYGMHDTRHSSILSVHNPAGTECGAIDKAMEIVSLGDEESDRTDASGELGPIGQTIGALYGNDPAVLAGSYAHVRHAYAQTLVTDLFANYNPAEARDATDPAHLELLDSDDNHPTHLHTEKVIGINEVAGHTLDRDACGGDLFWYDRWLARDLADLMGASQAEKDQLLMAADYYTVLTANRLVSPGMSVAVYK